MDKKQIDFLRRIARCVQNTICETITFLYIKLRKLILEQDKMNLIVKTAETLLRLLFFCQVG